MVGQENPLTNIYAAKLYEVQSHIMITAHMQSVLSVWVNEKSWQGIPEADREIMNGVFSEMAQTSLQWAQEADADIKDKLRAAGVTIIEKKDGLDVEAFRKAVLAQIDQDFPEWRGYIKRIQAIE